jgi:hypothetical protein
MGHRHKDSRLKWTTTDAEPEIPHPADVLTAAEVDGLKALLAAAGGGGGVTPVPNDPPPPTPDITAPTVSNVVISGVTSTGATISWTTSEAATGIVEYGESIAYGSQTAATASGTLHSRTLSGLVAGSTYHFRIRATDTAGNLRLDQDRTFSTTAVPVSGGSVMVSSISALLNARKLLTVSEVILVNGTYSMTWLDLGLVRTQAAPVLIRAETDGGVTLDLGGSSSPHLLFRNGLAYEEWRGFKFANSHPSDNGVIMFGEGNGTAVHHLTLRNIEFLSSITTGPGPNGNYTNGQGLYFSWSTTGNHDILVDGFVSNAELWAPIHIYHDEQAGPGHDITIRNATINCSGSHGQMGIVAWSAEITGYLFEDIDIAGANEYGVRHNSGGTMTFRRVTTTGSGVAGFYSNIGSYPSVSGITFDSCSFG